MVYPFELHYAIQLTLRQNAYFASPTYWCTLLADTLYTLAFTLNQEFRATYWHKQSMTSSASHRARSDVQTPSVYTPFRRNVCLRMQCSRLAGFYRAMLCIRGTSHGPVSVCLSVTGWSSTKTAKRRITQTTARDSPGTLVFWCQRSPRNSTGITPCGGTKCRWGGSKSATFDK